MFDIIEYTLDYKTRVDRFLKSSYPSLTKGSIHKHIRKKIIQIIDTQTNKKKKIQPCFSLNQGDKIKVPSYFNKHKLILASKEQIFSKTSDQVKKLADSIINDFKIYENENILVINKPCGVASQKGSNTFFSLSCGIKYLNEYFGYNMHLAHRLDKGTSGVMVIAKNKKTAILLAEAFQQKKITKEYVSINIASAKSDIVIDLQNNCHVSSIIQGKQSYSIASIQKKINKYTVQILWKTFTGRKHQIRIHSNLIKMPILGDSRYANLRCNKTPWTEKVGNLFLHMSKITLPDGISVKSEFSSNIPAYFDCEYINRTFFNQNQ